MATIKAVLRPPKDKQGKKPVYIRISDKGKTRYVSTGLKIKPALWNDRKNQGRENDYFDATDFNKIITDKIGEIENEMYHLKVNDQAVNADILKKKVKEGSKDFIAYAKTFADRKRRKNIQTGRRYDAVISKLEEYTGGNLPFNDLTVSWLKDYMDWLSDERGNKANTIHSNMRAIRAILYDAIPAYFPQEKNPFFKLKLTQPKVSKTKLSIEEIKAFSQQPAGSEFQELAKDLFLFSFFSCGMRFRDVAMLRYKNVAGGHIRYEMIKTGNSQKVVVYPGAKTVIEKYRRGDALPDDFMFPLIDVQKILRNLIPVDDSLTVKDLVFREAPGQREQKIQKELDRDISSKNAYVNKEIKKVATAAGITKDIHFHCSRHSYANIANEKKANLHELSQSLGHSSLKVTENYLQSLDNAASNDAASTVYEEF